MFSLLNDGVSFCFQALFLTSNAAGIFVVQYAARFQSSPIWSDPSLRLCRGLFLSGIGGWYPERRPKAGDIKQQTGDALEIMKASLDPDDRKLTNRRRWRSNRVA